jgi:HD-like signal output (HDOD) protein
MTKHHTQSYVVIDLEEKGLNTSVELKESITQLDSLPPMPVIAQKLLALELNTDEGEAMLLTLIGLDPLISAKIIGLANTGLFGANAKVTTISDAAMRLGLTRVKSVAIGIATLSTKNMLPEGQLKADDLWLNSMGIAFAMGAIAKAMPARTRPSDDRIFLAGLLHDIGYMALGFLDIKASDALYTQLQAQADRPLLDIDQELLGMTHCDIGAQLGLHWDLPEEIVAVIRYHHTPDEEGSAEGQPLVNMVNLAEKILPEFCIVKHSGEEVTEQDWEGLGIDPAKADDIRSQIAEVAAQAYEFAGAF